MLLSIVVPCRNGMPEFSRCLKAASDAILARSAPAEIVVADHGSTDGSAEWARAAAKQSPEVVLVVDASDATSIGDVRNRGAAEATGRFLYFLDADCELEPETLTVVLERCNIGMTGVAGAKVLPPPSGTWVERAWLGLHSTRVRKVVNYVNSGNLLMSRDDFDRAGAFDTTLTTGEDAELCDRVTELGLPVVEDPSMRVIHHRNARTLRAFFKKEIWHAIGMYERIVEGDRSPIALVTGLHFFALLTSTIVGMVLAARGTPGAGVGMIMLAGTIVPFLVTLYRKPRSIPECLQGVVLYSVYFMSRIVALRDFANTRRS